MSNTNIILYHFLLNVKCKTAVLINAFYEWIYFVFLNLFVRNRAICQSHFLHQAFLFVLSTVDSGHISHLDLEKTIPLASTFMLANIALARSPRPQRPGDTSRALRFTIRTCTAIVHEYSLKLLSSFFLFSSFLFIIVWLVALALIVGI